MNPLHPPDAPESGGPLRACEPPPPSRRTETCFSRNQRSRGRTPNPPGHKQNVENGKREKEKGYRSPPNGSGGARAPVRLSYARCVVPVGLASFPPILVRYDAVRTTCVRVFVLGVRLFLSAGIMSFDVGDAVGCACPLIVGLTFCFLFFAERWWPGRCRICCARCRPRPWLRTCRKSWGFWPSWVTVSDSVYANSRYHWKPWLFRKLPLLVHVPQLGKVKLSH